MSTRAIVNVATGAYVKGQRRMRGLFPEGMVRAYQDCLPHGSPPHSAVPYAFKAFALQETAQAGAETLLWADSCIVPGARPLDELWEKIERDGVWLARNGWTNYEWTAESAYPDLFPLNQYKLDNGDDFGMLHYKSVNREIPHVVATAFGISLKHAKGRAFFDEYYRLASETKAFCGPWINLPAGDLHTSPRVAHCGPADVHGHRHDQTAASVIAWRLGVELTNCPEWFSYRGGETDQTCLIADGAY